MTVQLPDMPARIARLRRDARGYPVPYFVQWMKDGRPVARGVGEPDFRIADEAFRRRAFSKRQCWVCGEPIELGRGRTYVIGPMCVVNRVTSEPACHRSCAEWSARACPFLTRPRMRRLPSADIPEALSPGGEMIERNPGCVCLYETREAKAFADGAGGWLIRLGPPARVDWLAEGRIATRAEIEASIGSGYPLLMDMARKEGDEAVRELERLRRDAERLLPAA
jgi:hypothetical protein